MEPNYFSNIHVENPDKYKEAVYVDDKEQILKHLKNSLFGLCAASNLSQYCNLAETSDIDKAIVTLCKVRNSIECMLSK